MQELDAYGADTFAPGDLPKLPYLEACLKEAMRLYPPGVFLIREPLTEDFHLQDITIPKGTWIHVRPLPCLAAQQRRSLRSLLNAVCVGWDAGFSPLQATASVETCMLRHHKRQDYLCLLR